MQVNSRRENTYVKENSLGELKICFNSAQLVCEPTLSVFWVQSAGDAYVADIRLESPVELDDGRGQDSGAKVDRCSSDHKGRHHRVFFSRTC